MDNFEKELKEKLLPIYSRMLENNTYEDVCTFCMQWGKNFPTKQNDGILFIGKAVNGWITDETDIEILFGNSKEKVFNREDQMEWVHNHEGNEKGYNTRKSAFWRVIKAITTNFYPSENWFSYIAWSNLCKIAPSEGGNPNDGLYYQQLEYCQELLAKEIEILSPKYVIFLTSGWEKDFLHYLNGNNPTKSVKKMLWNEYESKLFEINDIYYITSLHPQGKPEAEHVDTIIELMNN
jgi:hypothetical protein